MIPVNNYDVLAKISGDRSITDRDAMLALAKQGVDLFGNKVLYKDLGDGNFHIQVTEANLSPIYLGEPLYWFWKQVRRKYFKV